MSLHWNCLHPHTHTPTHPHTCMQRNTRLRNCLHIYTICERGVRDVYKTNMWVRLIRRMYTHVGTMVKARVHMCIHVHTHMSLHMNTQISR